MLPTAARWGAAFLLRSPLPELIFRHRARARLTVLAYHRVCELPDTEYPFDHDVISASPEEFDRELSFFRRNLDVLSLTDLLDCMSGERRMPARPALITFDDGYVDNHDVAFPLLREHGLPALFFVSTHLVGTANIPWWDQVACCFKLSRVRSVPSSFDKNDAPYLTDPAHRQASMVRFLRRLKDAPWPAALSHLEYLRDACRVNPADHLTEPLFMSWDAVRRMAAGGMEIGSHSRTHPVLAGVEDPDILRHEIQGSSDDIRRQIGGAPLAFSYPVERRETSDAAGTEVRRAGYKLCFSYEHGFAPAVPHDMYQLPRLRAEFKNDHGEFLAAMALAPIAATVKLAISKPQTMTSLVPATLPFVWPL
jgi:peptidoglycan/xylan/chitin deacetylase (PgdA/CDA1 family)